MALRVGSLFLWKNTLNETKRRICISTVTRQTNAQQQTPAIGSLPISKEKSKAEKISHAMLSFLERTEQYEKTLQVKEAEFEVGKRHLAKMMGYDPNKDEFTQEDIDKAIEYLLPSGLFQKKARPFLKPPRTYYPKIKELQFDREGRPYHYLFYTSKPKYYELIDVITNKIYSLDKTLDDLQNVDINTTKSQELALTIYDDKGTKWIDQNTFAKKISEKLTDEDYQRFVNVMERLIKHPLSKKEEEFINSYRETLKSAISKNSKQEFKYTENGTPYVSYSIIQRTAKVDLILMQGNGNIEIVAPEGKFDILFFRELKHREQLLFPFKITNTINKYDVKLTVNDGGMSCIAKASRFAISNALCSFLTETDNEKLRLAGLLTYDRRIKERKKPGQEGARRKFTWKKR